jgi:probable 2-oxoglutarate dehydrogenase E1 component DHKTD1
VLDAAGISEMRTAYKDKLEEELKASETYEPVADHLQNQWSEMVWPGAEDAIRDPETGVGEDTLKQVAKASVAVPTGFVSGMSAQGEAHS